MRAGAATRLPARLAGVRKSVQRLQGVRGAEAG